MFFNIAISPPKPEPPIPAVCCIASASVLGNTIEGEVKALVQDLQTYPLFRFDFRHKRLVAKVFKLLDFDIICTDGGVDGNDCIVEKQCSRPKCTECSNPEEEEPTKSKSQIRQIENEKGAAVITKVFSAYAGFILDARETLSPSMWVRFVNEMLDVGSFGALCKAFDLLAKWQEDEKERWICNSGSANRHAGESFPLLTCEEGSVHHKGSTTAEDKIMSAIRALSSGLTLPPDEDIEALHKTLSNYLTRNGRDTILSRLLAVAANGKDHCPSPRTATTTDTATTTSTLSLLMTSFPPVNDEDKRRKQLTQPSQPPPATHCVAANVSIIEDVLFLVAKSVGWPPAQSKRRLAQCFLEAFSLTKLATVSHRFISKVGTKEEIGGGAVASSGIPSTKESCEKQPSMGQVGNERKEEKEEDKSMSTRKEEEVHKDEKTKKRIAPEHLSDIMLYLPQADLARLAILGNSQFFCETVCDGEAPPSWRTCGLPLPIPRGETNVGSANALGSKTDERRSSMTMCRALPRSPLFLRLAQMHMFVSCAPRTTQAAFLEALTAVVGNLWMVGLVDLPLKHGLLDILDSYVFALRCKHGSSEEPNANKTAPLLTLDECKAIISSLTSLSSSHWSSFGAAARYGVAEEDREEGEAILESGSTVVESRMRQISCYPTLLSEVLLSCALAAERQDDLLTVDEHRDDLLLSPDNAKGQREREEGGAKREDSNSLLRVQSLRAVDLVAKLLSKEDCAHNLMRMGTFDYFYLSSSSSSSPSGIDERDLKGNTFILKMLIPMIALHLRFRVFFDEKSSEQQASTSSSFGPKCEAADKFFAEFGGVTRQEERVFCDDDHHGDGETASSLGEGFNASSCDSQGNVVKTIGEASTVMCPAQRQTVFSSLLLTHLTELWCERRLNAINSRQTKSEAVTSAKTSSLLPENTEEKGDGMKNADEAKTAKGTSTTTVAESTDAASHTTSTANCKRSSLFSLLREAVNCLHGDLGRSKAN